VSLGPAEILVIFVVALLVFGPTRLPEVGRQVGRGIRELRKFQQTITSDLNDLIPDDVSDHVEPAPSLPPIAVDPPATPSPAEPTSPDPASPDPVSLDPASSDPSSPPDRTA
jgi:TatA/E family protein of Tat protein translocase